jgi:RNA polymerase sigma-70 factor, ECF subfamily
MVRVRAGDADAFRSLFEKYSGAVTRFASSFTGTHARAEELAQEVFVQVYRARERYEPRAKFSTWLYTIAHNLCLNEVRRYEYRGRVESLDQEDPASGLPRSHGMADPDAPEGESVASGRELDARIRDLLAGLPESQRVALLLSRVEELRYREIGEVLGCSEQAVKSLIFRATRALREGLKEDGAR